MNFSATRKSKGKLFAYRDHSKTNDRAEVVWKAFQKIIPKIKPFDQARRIKANRELMLQKLQKISEIPGMELYEPVERNQFPKSYHTFRSLVNQHATPDVSSSKDILVDWNLPIKLKLILLPDQIT